MGDDAPALVPGSALEQDVGAAKDWLFEQGCRLNRLANAYENQVDLCLDRVTVIAVCMQLPGDWPLRVRLFSNGRAFELQA